MYAGRPKLNAPHAVSYLAVLISLTVSLSFSQQHTQTEERLFCSVCAKQNEIRSSFCFQCGDRLDKSALLARLKIRAAAADSAKQSLVLTPAELSVLVQDEAELKAREMFSRGKASLPPRLKTDVEKTLDVVIPVIFGSVAVLLIMTVLQ